MFLAVVFGQLFFRETDIHQILADLGRLPFQPNGDYNTLHVATYLLFWVAIYSAPLWVFHYLDEAHKKGRLRVELAQQAAAIAVLLFGIAAMYSRVPVDFIYFQF
jgi:hypothetical protein